VATPNNVGTSWVAQLRAAMAARTPAEIEQQAAERRMAEERTRRRAVRQLRKVADASDATLVEAVEAVGNMLNSFDGVKRHAILTELLTAYLAARRQS
jgi:hypothetical protein